MSHFNDCLFGIYEKSLPDTMTIEEKIHNFCEAGYDFFELSIDESDEKLLRVKWSIGERRAFRNRIESSGMSAYSICLSANRKYPIGSMNLACRMNGLQLIKDTVDLALDVGARVILIPGYDEYYGESNETTRKLFLESLHIAADYAGGRGVFLALENIETDFMNSTQKSLEYVSQVNHPSLKLYADIGNMEASLVDCIEGLRYAKSNIVSVHLKDALPGKYKNVRYGTGSVDFNKVFKQLKDDGYSGLYVAEINALNGVQESIQNIQNVRTYLMQMYDQVKTI